MANIPEVILTEGCRAMPVVGMGTFAYPFSPENARSAIVDAMEMGYRHFDTASLYGSEEPLGEAIVEAQRLGLVNTREELFITSKLRCNEAHPDLVIPAIKKSLRNLKTEYLDLYLIHMPFSTKPGSDPMPVSNEDLVPMDTKGIWQAMEECKRLGLAKAIGVSNFTTKKLTELLTIANVPPQVNQVEMNPTWQQKKLRAYCNVKGIHVTAYSPLGGQDGFNLPNSVRKSEVLKEIANARGKTVAQRDNDAIIEDRYFYYTLELNHILTQDSCLCDSCIVLISKWSEALVLCVLCKDMSMARMYKKGIYHKWMKKIWKRKDILPRVKSFLWRCLANALPTNARRAAIVPHFNSLCVGCNSAEESLEHLFFGCSNAMMVWSHLSIDRCLLPNEPFEKIIELWASINKETSALLITTLWAMWKACCDSIFRDIKFDVYKVVDKIHSYLGGIPNIIHHHTQPSRHLDQWRPHQSAIINVNVDGCECVRSDRLRENCAVVAEATGIFNAIRCAIDNWDVNVHIFSDAKVLVDSIVSGDQISPWQARHIIHDCIYLLNSNPRITLSFVNRECNKAAHIAAANASLFNLFGDWKFSEIPCEILQSLCIYPNGICLD